MRAVELMNKSSVVPPTVSTTTSTTPIPDEDNHFLWRGELIFLELGVVFAYLTPIILRTSLIRRLDAKWVCSEFIFIRLTSNQFRETREENGGSLPRKSPPRQQNGDGLCYVINRLKEILGIQPRLEVSSQRLC